MTQTTMKCWCGMVVAPSRLHYPGNDPENGPAHLPSDTDPYDDVDDDADIASDK